MGINVRAVVEKLRDNFLKLPLRSRTRQEIKHREFRFREMLPDMPLLFFGERPTQIEQIW